ncbi:MAG: protein-methionine-sulfoxide reductase catalytic subunit MsrP [Gemmataceae bacterium]
MNPRDITPEDVALNRRRWLVSALGSIGLGGLGVGLWYAYGRPGSDAEVQQHGQAKQVPGAELYPAPRHPDFTTADRPLTEPAVAARYTNFFEFSTGKSVWRYVDNFEPHPWTLEVTGLVSRPKVWDMDKLVRSFPLEERVYRFRCVEAWAMVVPWVGFPLAKLLAQAEPLAAARYVRFVSFDRPDQAGHMTNRRYPWPYTEGLTLAEATHPLTLLVTGMYGQPLLKQHGAPVRLVVPWKYGFKSAKSLVRIEVTDRQPATFWNTLVPHEYDFWANVNPTIPHPRWSQASERLLGTGERRPTLPFNGYAEQVAYLYK